MKTKLSDIKPDIEKEAAALLSLLGFNDARVSLNQQPNEPVEANIDLPPSSAGMLIGRHGEVIDALQLILAQIINFNQPTWQPLTVNVADYRQKRELILKEMAAKAALAAKNSGKPVSLSFLPSHERRFVHLFLSHEPDIETYSEGVGRYRRLVIKPVLNQ